MTLFYIILSGILICSCSIFASAILLLNESLLKKVIFPLVSLSSGVLLGSAFLFLIPEGVELLGNNQYVFFLILLGFLSFFFLEDLLEWHHCHGTINEHKHLDIYNDKENHKLKEHKLGWLITFSDLIHNSIDGATIAATFMISPTLGFMATLSTFLHELPQEIGDVGILIHSGFSKKKSFLVNLFSQFSFFVGAFLVYIFDSKELVNVLIPFTAGVFIYISAVDLVPEIKKSHSLREKLFHSLFFVGGIVFIYFIMSHLHHSHF